MTRKEFLVTGITGALAMSTASSVHADDERDYPAPKFVPNFRTPQLGKTLVQDFVIFAHSEIDMVKKLLDKQPALINATMDWGGGDWETGLGGAAHMGRKDIIELLLEKGARIDIFASCMLGHLDVVKSLLTAHPKLKDAKGPHGFNLAFHAKAGGKNAEPVLQYLATLGILPPPPKAPAKAPDKDKAK